MIYDSFQTVIIIQHHILSQLIFVRVKRERLSFPSTKKMERKLLSVNFMYNFYFISYFVKIETRKNILLDISFYVLRITKFINYLHNTFKKLII